jgi:outer membrane murein-binding lipoprotein Lpp
VNDEALDLADDLANINKAKNMWHFEEAAKHIRELSAKVKELEKKLNELERK